MKMDVEAFASATESSGVWNETFLVDAETGDAMLACSGEDGVGELTVATDGVVDADEGGEDVGDDNADDE